MKKIYTYLLAITTLWGQNAQAQLYFPPTTGNTWETLSPASLGWCEDKISVLYNYLGTEGTKGFIVLKDGKIVLEKYFGTFTKDSLWYWASAGKSVTSVLVGIAQQEGLLNIENKTSSYLGTGWSSAPPAKEALITVKNQLSMTTGLDDGVYNPNCTLSSCLQYLANADTRWAYHNAPYTLLDEVITNATGQTLNAFFITKIRNKIGMNGSFVANGGNNVLFSNTRSAARFGLLMLNKGAWATTSILSDQDYYNAMTRSSQALNPAYGYLWWLNGKSSYKIPQSQTNFQGMLFPSAPADMFSALGKNGQFINVVPSKNLVLIRLGNSPNSSPVPFLLNEEIWKRMNDIICNSPTALSESQSQMMISPNPVQNMLKVSNIQGDFWVSIADIQGRECLRMQNRSEISVETLANGIYFLQVIHKNGILRQKICVQK